MPSFKRPVASAVGQATGSILETSPETELSDDGTSESLANAGTCPGSVPRSCPVSVPGQCSLEPESSQQSSQCFQPPAGHSPRRPSPKGTQHVHKRSCSPNAFPKNAKGTRSIGNVTLFYGKPSSFSNFHEAQFLLDGVTYNCSEQYYCSQKALTFGARGLAERVKQMTNPINMKSSAKARNIPGYRRKTWYEKATLLLTRACLAKFSQNAKLREELLATGDNLMAEANPDDTHWGIGMPLDDQLAADQSNWKGLNCMGTILQKVRACLRDNPDLTVTTTAECDQLLGN